LDLRGDLPSQLTGRKTALQLAGCGEIKQHLRVPDNLFGDEITGRTDAVERNQTLSGPGIESRLTGSRQ
jgi:hypothetical protein